MPDENDDFLPSDIPHDVVIQEALAPYLGGFEQAEDASKAAYAALYSYGRAVVEAEDLRAYLDRGSDLQREVEALNRLRAALPERTETDA